MTRFNIPSDFLRTLCLALALIGVLALAYAAYQYIDARRALDAAPDLDAAALEPAQREALLSTPPALLIARREAVQQQTRSLIIGGLGLVALGVGWLGYDVLKRRPISNQSPPSPS